jgi:uncharacterized protein (DUF58 family)
MAAPLPYRARPLLGPLIRLYEQRFTARGRWLLWAIATFALVGVDTRRTQVYQLFAVAFALLFVASVYVSLRQPRLQLAGRLPSRLTAGRSLPLTLRVSTAGGQPQDDVQVAWPRPFESGPVPEAKPRESYVALEPGEPTELSLELHAPRRGRFRVRGPTARASDPLRLVTSRPVWVSEETVVVYPRYFTVDELSVPLGRRYQPGGIPLTSSTGDAIEFVGTRDYREGDPPRNIHWRSWARRGQPVVKEYQEEYFCRIALILDTFLPQRETPADREAFEAGVSVLASVADYFSRSEFVVDILAAGPDVYEVSAGRSLAYLDNILDVLACLEPCYDPPFSRIGPHLFEKLARLTTVVAVLQDWDDGREAFLRRVREEGTSVRGFVVRESAPAKPLPVGHELGEITAMSPADVRDAIDSGGTMRIVSEGPGVGAVRG